jgi:hypothetical protein
MGTRIIRPRPNGSLKRGQIWSLPGWSLPGWSLPGLLASRLNAPALANGRQCVEKEQEDRD